MSDSLKTLAARADELRRALERASYEYYVLDRPEISDCSTIACSASCRSSRRSTPALRTLDSPTQRVGAEPQGQLAKHTHLVPMISLGNAFDDDELASGKTASRDWSATTMRDGGYICGAQDRWHGGQPHVRERRARDRARRAATASIGEDRHGEPAHPARHPAAAARRRSRRAPWRFAANATCRSTRSSG